ncbi:MAG: tetraacyldisaccharide 4'-kinase [Acidobacteria bacterium]|nr:tetraacyldisaccharide 4'-kinase [Acidobacteriota bacterium]
MQTNRNTISPDSVLIKLLGRVPVFILQKLNVFRLFFYKAGFLSSYCSKIPVISIGNIVMGGSGKTPFTIWLVEALQAKGKKPLIITRGYGRKDENKQIILDSDSLSNNNPEEIGDEPYLLKMRLPGTIIICDSNRVRAAKTAENNFKPDVIILDDGFQHLKLKREIDILMIPPKKTVWKREFFWATRRADIAILTGNYRPVYRPGKIQYFSAERTLEAPVNFAHAKTLDKRKLIKNPVIATAGIADPSSFFTMLKNEGYTVKERISFPDHYSYLNDDVNKIEALAKETKCDTILTTEKDAVKFNKLKLSPDLWASVPLSLSIDHSEDLVKLIISRLTN